jgi:hypothetical protein
MSFFNLLLIFHIFSGCICLLTGGVAIFVRKRKGKHTLMGELYHAFFVIIFLTSSLMAFIHWSESAYLFYIGLFSYSFALFGYLAKKRKSKNWIGKHIGGMLGSYIAIITAVLASGVIVVLDRQSRCHRITT